MGLRDSLNVRTEREREESSRLLGFQLRQVGSCAVYIDIGCRGKNDEFRIRPVESEVLMILRRTLSGCNGNPGCVLWEGFYGWRGLSASGRYATQVDRTTQEEYSDCGNEVPNAELSRPHRSGRGMGWGRQSEEMKKGHVLRGDVRGMRSYCAS